MCIARYTLAVWPLLAACATGVCAAEKLRTDVEGWRLQEHLSRGVQPWSESGISIEAAPDERQAFGARWRETRRFGLRDREAGLTLRQPFARRWAAGLDVTASGSHQILPRSSVLGEIQAQWDGGWGTQLGLKRSRYASSDTELRLATVERYVGNHRLAYTFYSGRVDFGGSAPAHRVQWSYFPSERSSFGISAASGREIESIAPGTLLSTEVRSAALFARYSVRPGWILSAETSAHDQGAIYRRYGLRLGLRARF